MAELCQQRCYYDLGKNGLPPGFSVHHMDFDKQHNCGSNLLLLEDAIHNMISWWSWSEEKRKLVFGPIHLNMLEDDAPAWVTEDLN